MASSSASDNVTRPLDAMAAAIVVVLCLSWGFNQVSTKLAIHDVPPLTQAAIRSVVATLLIAGWCTCAASRCSGATARCGSASRPACCSPPNSS